MLNAMKDDLADYLSVLEARNYSHSRLVHVQRAVWMLMLFLKEAHRITDWRAVSPIHLNEFMVFASKRYRTRKGRQVGVNTLRQWLSCIRGFFAWMRLRGRLIYNPAELSRLPHRSQSLPLVLSEQAIAQLIEMPDTKTALGIRDRALMEMLYATGIRHSEVYRLNIFDVDTSSELLIVRQGKGRRDRCVPLTEAASQWLSRYITAARPQLAAVKSKGRERPLAPTSALWLSIKGHRLSYQMIAERISEYAAQAELKATVHTFRHSCATHLLRGGAGIRHVQLLLGHETIETTEIYTQVEIEDLRQAIVKAS